MEMKVTIPRKEIKEAVAGFGKIVSGKTTLPVLGCVRFDNDKGVSAQVTDLDQYLRYRFAEARAVGDGAFVVPLAALKDLAKGSDGENVEIEAGDNGGISVTNHVGSHAVKRPLQGLDPEEWPQSPAKTPTKPAEGFLATYRRLVPFSSTDTTRHVLNSVYVEVAETGENPVTMVATDGRRLALWNTMCLPLAMSTIVPTTKFLQWTGLGQEARIGLRTEQEKKETRVLGLAVAVGPWTYDVRTIDGSFPNFRQVIPAEPGEHAITFADSDVELLRKVLPTFPGDETVTLLGSGNTLTLYGRGPDDAQATKLELESTRYKGKRAFIGLNRHYLLEALDAGFREFSIKDELTPVVSRDGKGGTHVLMPLRVQDPEQADGVESAAKPDTPSAQEEPAAPEVAAPPESSPQAPVTKSTATSTTTKEEPVTKDNDKKSDVPGLDRVLVACNTARIKVKEADQALTALASSIKDAAREQRTQGREVEQARATLAKLQAISL